MTTTQEIERVVGFVNNRIWGCLWNYHPCYQGALDAAVAAGELMHFNADPGPMGEHGLGISGYWRDPAKLRYRVVQEVRSIMLERRIYKRPLTSEGRTAVLSILREYRRCVKELAA